VPEHPEEEPADAATKAVAKFVALVDPPDPRIGLSAAGRILGLHFRFLPPATARPEGNLDTTDGLNADAVPDTAQPEAETHEPALD
jgi:hypothetical protein